jgi:hypothetical protein
MKRHTQKQASKLLCRSSWEEDKLLEAYLLQHVMVVITPCTVPFRAAAAVAVNKKHPLEDLL